MDKEAKVKEPTFTVLYNLDEGLNIIPNRGKYFFWDENEAEAKFNELLEKDLVPTKRPYHSVDYESFIQFKAGFEAGKQEERNQILKALRERLTTYENQLSYNSLWLDGFESAIYNIDPIRLEGNELENLSK